MLILAMLTTLLVNLLVLIAALWWFSEREDKKIATLINAHNQLADTVRQQQSPRNGAPGLELRQ